MKIATWRWLSCGVLAFSMCLLARNSLFSADEDSKKAVAAAQKDVLELAEGKGNAQDVAKKHALEHVMHGFKLKNKGGIGVEGVAAPNKNGIEAQVITVAKTPMTKMELAKMSAGLIKMAQATQAIGKVAAYHKVDKPKEQPEWDKYNKDMMQQSEALIKAIKSMDPTAVKMVGNKLNQACNECHGKFRDANN